MIQAFKASLVGGETLDRDLSSSGSPVAGSQPGHHQFLFAGVFKHSEHSQTLSSCQLAIEVALEDCTVAKYKDCIRKFENTDIIFSW